MVLVSSYPRVVVAICILGCAFALSSLGGCAQGPRRAVLPEGMTRTALTADQVARVKRSVARRLKDPESARFSERFAASSGGGLIHACGYVNAKNSYGGYVGEYLFYAAVDAKTFELVDSALSGPNLEEFFIADACRKFGVDPP